MGEKKFQIGITKMDRNFGRQKLIEKSNCSTGVSLSSVEDNAEGEKVEARGTAEERSRGRAGKTGENLNGERKKLEKI